MTPQNTVIDLPLAGTLTISTHADGDPYISGCIQLGKIYEPHILDVLSHFLRPGDRFLNVGGNLGWFAMIGSRLVGELGHADAIEPDPENYRLLVQNLKANGCGNTRAWQGGAGAKAGRLQLFQSAENRGDHRIAAHPIAGRPSVTVPVRAMDRHLRWDRRLDTALIDTQGSEVHVLRGMRQVLRRNPMLRVIFEYWPCGLETCGSTTAELAELVRAQGWRLWLLDEDVREIGADDLVTLGEGEFTPASGRHADVVALSPQDRLAAAYMEGLKLPPH